MRICTVDPNCTDPVLDVRMSLLEQPTTSIPEFICARHAVFVSDLGFHVFALSTWVDMTEYVGAQFLREITPWLDKKWQEVGVVDRLICRYGCKLHARLEDGRPRVYVIHSKTYGCKVG